MKRILLLAVVCVLLTAGVGIAAANNVSASWHSFPPSEVDPGDQIQAEAFIQVDSTVEVRLKEKQGFLGDKTLETTTVSSSQIVSLSTTTEQLSIGPGETTKLYLEAKETESGFFSGPHSDKTSATSVSIATNDPPTIDSVDLSANDDRTVTVEATVTDDTGVETVKAEWGGGFLGGNSVTLEKQFGDTYRATIGPFDPGQSVDVTVTATDSSSQSKTASQSETVQIPTNDPPTIDSVDLSIDDRTVTVEATVTDDTGVDTVKAEWGGGFLGGNSVTLEKQFGDTYEATIPSSGVFDWGKTVDVTVTGTDNFDESSSESKTANIRENTPPEIISIQANENDDRTITIEATVTDQTGGVETVEVNWGGGIFGSNSATLDRQSGNTYETTIGPFDWGRSINPTVNAVDSTGKNTRNPLDQIILPINRAPNIGKVTTKRNDDRSITITAIVEDTTGDVESVKAKWGGGIFGPNSATLNREDTNTYQTTIGPFDWGRSIDPTVSATDSPGKTNNQDVAQIDIEENIPPEILSQTIKVNDDRTITLTATVEDTTGGVKSVKAKWGGGIGGIGQNSATLDRQSGNTYRTTIGPFDWGKSLNPTLTATDFPGKNTQNPLDQIILPSNQAPDIEKVTTKRNDDRSITITAIVEDTTGDVENVKTKWGGGIFGPNSATLERQRDNKNTYQTTIGPFDWGRSIDPTVSATDSPGKTNNQDVAQIVIPENIAPDIGNFETEINNDGTITIEATVTDQTGGIETVKAEWGGGLIGQNSATLNRQSGNTYETTIGPFGAGDSVSPQLIATDGTGKQTTENKEVVLPLPQLKISTNVTNLGTYPSDNPPAIRVDVSNSGLGDLNWEFQDDSFNIRERGEDFLILSPSESVTGEFGRNIEITALNDELDGPSTRSVTITGTASIVPETSLTQQTVGEATEQDGAITVGETVAVGATLRNDGPEMPLRTIFQFDTDGDGQPDAVDTSGSEKPNQVDYDSDGESEFGTVRGDVESTNVASGGTQAFGMEYVPNSADDWQVRVIQQARPGDENNWVSTGTSNWEEFTVDPSIGLNIDIRSISGQPAAPNGYRFGKGIDSVTLKATDDAGNPVSTESLELNIEGYGNQWVSLNHQGNGVYQYSGPRKFSSPTEYLRLSVRRSGSDKFSSTTVPVISDTSVLEAPVEGWTPASYSSEVSVDGTRYVVVKMIEDIDPRTYDGRTLDSAYLAFRQDGTLVTNSELRRKIALSGHVGRITRSHDNDDVRYLRKELPNNIDKVITYSELAELTLIVRDTGAETLGTIAGAVATGGGNIATQATVKGTVKTVGKKFAKDVLTNYISEQIPGTAKNDPLAAFEKGIKWKTRIELLQAKDNATVAGNTLADHIDGETWTYEDANQYWTAYNDTVTDVPLYMELRTNMLPSAAPKDQLISITESAASGATGVPVSNLVSLIQDEDQFGYISKSFNETASLRIGQANEKESFTRNSQTVQQQARQSYGDDTVYAPRDETSKSATISIVSAPSGQYTPGQQVNTTVEVTNTGSTAGRFFIGYSAGTTVNGEQKLYDNDGTTGEYVHIASGQTIQTSVNWTAPAYVPQQQNYDVVTAVWSSFPESGSDVQQLDRSKRNDVFSVVSGADIQLQSIEATDTTVEEGKRTTIIVEVSNSGDIRDSRLLNLTSGGQVRDQYVASVDPGETVSAVFTTSWDNPGQRTVQVGEKSLNIDVIEANQPPTASFSPSIKNPALGDTVSFDATSSTDPDGNIAAYRWDFDDDGTVDQITDTPTTQTTFDQAGSFDVTLNITDDDGESSDAIRVVSVTPGDPPVANLSIPTANPDVGQAVRLDASGSTDPDGDKSALSYEWTVKQQPPGADAATPNGPQGTISLLQPGAYTFEVTVTDKDGKTDTTTERIRLRRPPVSLTFTDQTVTNGSTTLTVDTAQFGNQTIPGEEFVVVIHKTTESIYDDEIGPKIGESDVLSPGTQQSVEVDLSQTLGPSDDIDTVRNSQSLVAMLHRADTDDGDNINHGSHITRDGAKVTSRAQLTVSPPPGDLVADAGPDQTVTAGKTVELSASGSTAPDESALAYAFQQVSQSGSSPDVSLQDPDTRTPEFTAPDVDSETTVPFELTVTNSAGTTTTDTDTDQVNITITPADDPPLTTSLTFNDQTISSGSATLTVDTAQFGNQTVSGEKFVVVVHKTTESTYGDEIGPKVGESDVLSPGAQQSVEVDLSRTLGPSDDIDTVSNSQSFVAMLHRADTDDGDNINHGSHITRDGAKVTSRAQVTVRDQDREQATLKLQPQTVSVQPGETVTTDVVVNTTEAEALAGAETSLQYNSSLFDATVSGGAFLSSDGADTNTPVPPTVNETTGTIEYSEVRLASDGMNGEGTLFTVTLEATRSVSEATASPLRITQADLSTPDQQSIPSQLQNGTATIQPQPPSTVEVQPTDQELVIQPTGTASVDVVVNATQPLAASSASLEYNTSLLNATVSGGPFLSSDGADTNTPVPPTVNETTGTVSYSEFRLTPEGITGEGVLFTVVFEPTQTGAAARGTTTPVTLTDVSLSTPDQQPVPTQLSNTTATIPANTPPTLNATLQTTTNNVGAPLTVDVNATDAETAVANLSLSRIQTQTQTQTQTSTISESQPQAELTTTPTESSWTGDGYAARNYTVTASDTGGLTTTEIVATPVYIPGDTNGDGVVDIFDAVAIGSSWQAQRGQDSYSDAGDLNNDGVVDIFDAVAIGSNWQRQAQTQTDTGTQTQTGVAAAAAVPESTSTGTTADTDADAGTGAVVSVTPQTTQLSTNATDPFTVDVVVNTTQPLAGVQADLEYNTSVLNASVSGGPFLSSDDAETNQLVPPSVNETTGTVSYNEVRLASEGITGNGTVFTVTFEPTEATPDSQLSLTGVKLSDPGRQPIVTQLQNGTVTTNPTNNRTDASVTFKNQSVSNGSTSVTVDSANFTQADGSPGDYVVVVHTIDEFGAPVGNVSAPIGASGDLTGAEENITVDLTAADGPIDSITGNVTLRAMLHTTASDSAFGTRLGNAIDGIEPGDETGDANITVEEAPADPSVSVNFTDQTVPNGSTSVTIGSATFNGSSQFNIVVHEASDDNGDGTIQLDEIGTKIGESVALKNGTTTDITVDISKQVAENDTVSQLTESQTLVAMLHTTNTSDGDSNIHAAPITRNGTPVFNQADVTVEKAPITTVQFNNQTVLNGSTTVTVESAQFGNESVRGKDFVVVVHETDDGDIGTKIGESAVIAGNQTNSNITVNLSKQVEANDDVVQLTESQELVAMLHTNRTGDGDDINHGTKNLSADTPTPVTGRAQVGPLGLQTVEVNRTAINQPGQPVKINATVSNEGATENTIQLALRDRNTEQLARSNISVASETARAVSFNVTPTQTETFSIQGPASTQNVTIDVAELALEDATLVTQQPVTTNDTVVVNATVANTGTATGFVPLTLRQNGTVLNSTTKEIPADSTVTAQLQSTTSLDEGTQNLTVTSSLDNQSADAGTITVSSKDEGGTGGGNETEAQIPLASVTFTNQTVVNGSTSVTVANATFNGSTQFNVVVHEASDDNGDGTIQADEIGTKIGESGALNNGTTTDIAVDINKPVADNDGVAQLTENQTLAAMLHTTNTSDDDGITHAAAITRNGTPVFDQADIIIEEDQPNAAVQFDNQIVLTGSTEVTVANATFSGSKNFVLVVHQSSPGENGIVDSPAEINEKIGSSDLLRNNTVSNVTVNLTKNLDANLTQLTQSQTLITMLHFANESGSTNFGSPIVRNETPVFDQADITVQRQRPQIAAVQFDNQKLSNGSTSVTIGSATFNGSSQFNVVVHEASDDDDDGAIQVDEIGTKIGESVALENDTSTEIAVNISKRVAENDTVSQLTRNQTLVAMLHTTNTSDGDGVVHTAPITRNGTPVFDQATLTDENGTVQPPDDETGTENDGFGFLPAMIALICLTLLARVRNRQTG